MNDQYGTTVLYLGCGCQVTRPIALSVLPKSIQTLGKYLERYSANWACAGAFRIRNGSPTWDRSGWIWGWSWV